MSFLVTYGSDESYNEEEMNEKLGDNKVPENKMKMNGSTPDTTRTNLRSSTSNTPKVTTVKTRKKKSKHRSIGLVSYGMDDEDDVGSEDNDESDASVEKLSNENESVVTGFGSTGLVKPDFDENYEPDMHDSDMDVDSIDNPEEGKAPETDSMKDDAKTEKCHILTERPQGGEVAYLLSRQIHKTKVVELPPPPPTKASDEIEQRLQDMKNRLRNAPDSVSKILNNKEYRNPSIYEKLIQHLKIDERGTNYPPELYDPYRFNETSYYEHLAKAQEEAEKARKVEKDKQDSKATVTSRTKSSVDSKVRLTKWDSGSTVKAPKNPIAKSLSATSLGGDRPISNK